MSLATNSFISLASNPPNYESVARLQNEFKNRDEFIVDGVIPFLEQILFPYISKEAHILDLGCGCGHLVQQLHLKGYQMTGIDASKGLLGYAQTNAPDSEFIFGDIRNFELPPTFNAIISIDVLLFILNNEDLTAIFKNVYAALQDNGLFVFSIPLIELMDKQTQEGSFNHIYVNDECAFIELFNYNSEKKMWKIEVTGFELVEKTWKRSDTTWLRKDHLFTDVQSALENVGFTEISHVDAGGLGGSACFVCWKHI
ncbi:class I SAM-dependent methyltransferase [Nostoc sp. PA-18-2419]|uniref:class I SAM-dependent methyltransferase n=1 Tax=Nostoc sp. PA-18-2419 TaxID=2575443 RepID=UPI001CB99C14|nr:class I SAM-dependent methyltransferase [Nostoc sp. PA-18-2419]